MDKKDITKLLTEMKLPNSLTLLRIILTPLIIVFLLTPSYDTKVISLILFVFACITDKIDGTIARRYDITTKFGKFMDPVADKILLNSLLIVLAALDILKWWMVALMVFRELFVQALRIIAEWNELEIYATIGKIKGPMQMAIIITAMYFMITSFQSGKSVIDAWMLDTLSIMMIFALFVAYSAMFEFLIKNWQSFNSLIKKRL
jgi:CDP-diacylglycerol--glycerol-3-phosphate 3-phosphatidyltransferase